MVMTVWQERIREEVVVANMKAQPPTLSRVTEESHRKFHSE
jgi:hypothetical protein